MELQTKIIYDHGMEWKISYSSCSSYNEAIATKKETLYRGDKDALAGVIYKKFLLSMKF